MSGEIRCMVPFCAEPAAASLKAQLLCVPHFISYCYGWLDGCTRELFSPPHKEEVKLAQAFLQECLQRTVDLCLARGDLNNLERAKLFDIILSVSEVATKLDFLLHDQLEALPESYTTARVC